MQLTQRALGRLTGWSQGMISAYESGLAVPGAERLVFLLRFAVTDEERESILNALERHGVVRQDLASHLVAPGFEGASTQPAVAPFSGGDIAVGPEVCNEQA
jgi:transcriptional regulator with XRE-family HTH domain